MAQPIPVQVPPRDPARELRARLDRIPEEHGQAILVACDVLQELHDRGVLEIVRGALAASDDILERVVDNVKTPEAVRALRNLIFWRQILGSIEPDWFKGIFQAIPEGIAQATADRDKPVNIFGLLRRLLSRDSLRAFAAAVDFLQALGRHLHTLEFSSAAKKELKEEL
jgi:uncharacterized protein YjgD (DUF1641 family)